MKRIDEKFNIMVTVLTQSRLMTSGWAKMIDEGKICKTLYSAISQYYVTEQSNIVSDALNDKYAYLKEYPIERIFRDLRVQMVL